MRVTSGGGMTTVIAVDTSSDQGSIALLRADGSLLTESWRGTAGHSVRLMSRLEALLARARITVRDLDLFAAVVGPGSFTGLRVGLSALQGISIVTGKPALGVSSLQAMAWAAAPQPSTIVALRNGYRRDAFYQRFDGMGRPAGEPGLAAVDRLDAISGESGTHVVGFLGTDPGALAPALARHAEEHYRSGVCAPLLPLYIRPVDIGVPGSR